jgi:hypothetical protein
MLRESIRNWLRLCGHAFTSTVHERLDSIERRLDHVERAISGNDAQFEKLLRSQAALLKASIHTVENLHTLAGRSVVESSTAPIAADLALIEFLYSFLPSRVLIEAGAHSPESTKALLNAGYDVRSMRADVGVGGLAYAASAGGPASSRRDVAVGVVDITGDALTEMDEIGAWRASVIAADCGPNFSELVSDMRGREYHWHVVLCSAKQGAVSAFSNGSTLPADSMGRAFFFRDYQVFAQAQAWCTATMPRVYFK